MTDYLFNEIETRILCVPIPGIKEVSWIRILQSSRQNLKYFGSQNEVSSTDTSVQSGGNYLRSITTGLLNAWTSGESLNDTSKLLQRLKKCFTFWPESLTRTLIGWPIRAYTNLQRRLLLTLWHEANFRTSYRTSYGELFAQEKNASKYAYIANSNYIIQRNKSSLHKPSSSRIRFHNRPIRVTFKTAFSVICK